MEHQQCLLEITQKLVCGSMTKQEWLDRVQEATTAMMNKVQQINL